MNLLLQPILVWSISYTTRWAQVYAHLLPTATDFGPSAITASLLITLGYKVGLENP